MTSACPWGPVPVCEQHVQGPNKRVTSHRHLKPVAAFILRSRMGLSRRAVMCMIHQRSPSG